MNSLSFTHFNLRYPDFKVKAVTLSYDDGQIFDRKMVEILDRYRLRCTFNLNSAIVGHSDLHITTEEIPELYKNHEVAIHALTHPFLEDLAQGNVAYQIIADRKHLENIMHRPIQGMAYPFGLKEVPGMVSTIAACGIRYARSTACTNRFDLPVDFLRWAPTCHQGAANLWELIDAFNAPTAPNTPLRRINPRLLYIYGHSFEYEHDWERLEEICRRLSGREEYWYATNGQIESYLTAARSLQFSADGKYVYNPTAAPIYGCTCADVFAQAPDAYVILPPGETVTL